ncbi:MAG: PepSY domain-containing protein, partial [Pseudomonadales bacterium]|nr:PepSY domain-containing protein [Pseudomonadales bacterium]
PRIDRQRAASMVKQHYATDKILSVDLIESKGPPVYRVKILSPDGVVKIVFVDGRSGDLFE